MNTTIALLIIGIIILFFALLSGSQEKRLYQPNELRPYISKNPLTLTEAMFYNRLVKALPEYIILAQVQISSFLKVDETQTNYQNYLKWFGPISQQSVDFLICRKDFSIVAAVELDDQSHNNPRAIERDHKKNNNLSAANVPLIRWHAERMPDTEMIKEEILKYKQDLVITQTENPDGFIDEPPQFLKRQPDIKKYFFVNIVVWLAIAIIVMATLNVIDEKIAIISNSHSPKLQSHPNEIHSITSGTPPLSVAEEQQQVQARLHAQQELMKQQELIAKQIQQSQTIEQEAALKLDAWNHYNVYKKTVECSEINGSISCGDKVEKNRRQFEYEWTNQRYKFPKTIN